MNNVIKKKKDSTNWKKMTVGDKILLIMEGFSYFLTLSTLTAVILVINKGFTISIIILLLSAVGFIGCGLDARSSRDARINRQVLRNK